MAIGVFRRWQRSHLEGSVLPCLLVLFVDILRVLGHK